MSDTKENMLEGLVGWPVVGLAAYGAIRYGVHLNHWPPELQRWTAYAFLWWCFGALGLMVRSGLAAKSLSERLAEVIREWREWVLIFSFTAPTVIICCNIGDNDPHAGFWAYARVIGGFALLSGMLAMLLFGKFPKPSKAPRSAPAPVQKDVPRIGFSGARRAALPQPLPKKITGSGNRPRLPPGGSR